MSKKEINITKQSGQIPEIKPVDGGFTYPHVDPFLYSEALSNGYKFNDERFFSLQESARRAGGEEDLYDLKTWMSGLEAVEGDNSKAGPRLRLDRMGSIIGPETEIVSIKQLKEDQNINPEVRVNSLLDERARANALRNYLSTVPTYSFAERKAAEYINELDDEIRSELGYNDGGTKTYLTRGARGPALNWGKIGWTIPMVPIVLTSLQGCDTVGGDIEGYTPPATIEEYINDPTGTSESTVPDTMETTDAINPSDTATDTTVPPTTPSPTNTKEAQEPQSCGINSTEVLLREGIYNHRTVPVLSKNGFDEVFSQGITIIENGQENRYSQDQIKNEIASLAANQIIGLINSGEKIDKIHIPSYLDDRLQSIIGSVEGQLNIDFDDGKISIIKGTNFLQDRLLPDGEFLVAAMVSENGMSVTTFSGARLFIRDEDGSFALRGKIRLLEDRNNDGIPETLVKAPESSYGVLMELAQVDGCEFDVVYAAAGGKVLGVLDRLTGEVVELENPLTAVVESLNLPEDNNYVLTEDWKYIVDESGIKYAKEVNGNWVEITDETEKYLDYLNKTKKGVFIPGINSVGNWYMPPYINEKSIKTTFVNPIIIYEREEVRNDKKYMVVDTKLVYEKSNGDEAVISLSFSLGTPDARGKIPYYPNADDGRGQGEGRKYIDPGTVLNLVQEGDQLKNLVTYIHPPSYIASYCWENTGECTDQYNAQLELIKSQENAIKILFEGILGGKSVDEIEKELNEECGVGIDDIVIPVYQVHVISGY